MEKKPREKPQTPRNERNENRVAARHRRPQPQSIRSGKVDNQSGSAETALDSAERSELENQLVGERHC